MSSRKNRRRFAPFWTGLACCALGCFYSCNDGYDLMDEDPAWLGSSIYDYLKSNGNYTNVVTWGIPKSLPVREVRPYL